MRVRHVNRARLCIMYGRFADILFTVQCRVLAGVASAMTATRHQRSLAMAKEIGRAALESVSPRELLGRSVRVTRVENEHSSAVMSVGGRDYTLDQ